MGSGLTAVELVPHPESEVRPLALEEVLAGLYRYGAPLSYEFLHDGKYVRLFLVGPAGVLKQVGKSLKAVFGKVIIEGAEPPSLKRMLPAESSMMEITEYRKLEVSSASVYKRD